MKGSKEIAIVVGSTGAMGQVITRRLSDTNMQVVAVARTADALTALAQQVPGIRTCVADIADDNSIAVIRAKLDGPVRMLVQGAGVATVGGVLEASTAAITAHLVAPGPADTDRLRRVASARGVRDSLSTEAVLEQMRGESAIGAFTTVEQIAWSIAMLFAPEADALAESNLFMDAGRRKGLP